MLYRLGCIGINLYVSSQRGCTGGRQHFLSLLAVNFEPIRLIFSHVQSWISSSPVPEKEYILIHRFACASSTGGDSSEVLVTERCVSQSWIHGQKYYQGDPRIPVPPPIEPPFFSCQQRSVSKRLHHSNETYDV